MINTYRKPANLFIAYMILPSLATLASSGGEGRVKSYKRSYSIDYLWSSVVEIPQLDLLLS